MTETQRNSNRKRWCFSRKCLERLWMYKTEQRYSTLPSAQFKTNTTGKSAV